MQAFSRAKAAVKCDCNVNSDKVTTSLSPPPLPSPLCPLQSARDGNASFLSSVHSGWGAALKGIQEIVPASLPIMGGGAKGGDDEDGKKVNGEGTREDAASDDRA